MKRRAVIYSTEAGNDLDWIYDSIAEASGPLRASHYEQRIRSFCESLHYASERGHRRDDIRPGLRIIGFERRVTVALVVEPENVVICASSMVDEIRRTICNECVTSRAATAVSPGTRLW